MHGIAPGPPDARPPTLEPSPVSPDPYSRRHPTSIHLFYSTQQEQDKKARLKGIDAIKANIAAAKSVGKILRTSLGPKGMDKMIQDGDGEVTVSECSGQLPRVCALRR